MHPSPLRLRGTTFMRNAIALAAALALFVGCASVQTNAGKLLASTAVTVDGAMQGWAAWVAQGRATADQEAKVKLAYSQYQASMSVAQAAFNTMVATGSQAGWSQASAVLTANQAALMSLTQLFIQGGAK